MYHWAHAECHGCGNSNMGCRFQAELWPCYLLFRGNEQGYSLRDKPLGPDIESIWIAEMSLLKVLRYLQFPQLHSFRQGLRQPFRLESSPCDRPWILSHGFGSIASRQRLKGGIELALAVILLQHKEKRNIVLSESGATENVNWRQLLGNSHTMGHEQVNSPFSPQLWVFVYVSEEVNLSQWMCGCMSWKAQRRGGSKFLAENRRLSALLGHIHLRWSKNTQCKEWKNIPSGFGNETLWTILRSQCTSLRGC